MNNVVERTYYDVELEPVINTTKIKIIEVSIELFSKKGFSGASIRDITKEVGIKESSLYKHFKNKDQILETIFVNFRMEADKILPPMEHIDHIVETMDLKMFLGRGIENFLRHIDNEINFKLWRILYIELFRQPIAQEIYRKDIMRKTIDCLETIFEKMMEKGKMKPQNPRIMAEEYQLSSISLILEYNMLKEEGMSTESIEEKIKNHVDFFSAIACP
ncbi:TetR/AcrR family transcriptional regulator [Cytobacillus sp. FJAT-54145]|uniref:TetR/AcrR family transcriptional regulator n=1 Tax=Cytobacillus spartinae TaxID=3299023 RepID=A0ABW6K6Z1_9BACI